MDLKRQLSILGNYYNIICNHEGNYSEPSKFNNQARKIQSRTNAQLSTTITKLQEKHSEIKRTIPKFLHQIIQREASHPERSSVDKRGIAA